MFQAIPISNNWISDLFLNWFNGEGFCKLYVKGLSWS